jgi:hypothetical protein
MAVMPIRLGVAKPELLGSSVGRVGHVPEALFEQLLPHLVVEHPGLRRR